MRMPRAFTCAPGPVGIPARREACGGRCIKRQTVEAAGDLAVGGRRRRGEGGIRAADSDTPGGGATPGTPAGAPTPRACDVGRRGHRRRFGANGDVVGQRSALIGVFPFFGRDCGAVRVVGRRRQGEGGMGHDDRGVELVLDVFWAGFGRHRLKEAK